MRRSRGRAVVAIAAAVLAAVACGVELDIRGGPDSGTNGSEGGAGEGSSPTDGAPPTDGGDGGTTTTTIGDASFSYPTEIALVAGNTKPIFVEVKKDPADPSLLSTLTITSAASDIGVKPDPIAPNGRNFVLDPSATSTPQRTTLSITATIGSETKTISDAVKVKLARYFRDAGDTQLLTIPATTRFEVLLWGAGGRSAGANGGGGGFAQGQLDLVGPIAVRVGGPGLQPGAGLIGGGAGGDNSGGGGGYSGIFAGHGAPLVANALIIAGGGGGSGNTAGGAGGGGGGSRGVGVQAGYAGSNAGGGPPGTGGGDATGGGDLMGGTGAVTNGGGGGGGGWFGGGGGDIGCGGGGGYSRADNGRVLSAVFDGGAGPDPGSKGHPLRQNAGSPSFPGAVLMTPID